MASGYPWTAWLFWIGGAMLALSGVVLFYWAMFRDRSHGRKRCPKCWYDLSGIAAAPRVSCPITCSECGRIVKRERKLFKIRRRWRYAFIACCVVPTGLAGTLFPRVQKDGWTSVVPTTILILGDRWVEIPTTSSIATPFGPVTTTFDWIEETLSARLMINAGPDPKDWGLSRIQWRMLIKNSLADDKPWRTSAYRFAPNLHHEILVHAFETGMMSELGFQEAIRAALGEFTIKGHMARRQGTDLVEWEFNRTSPEWAQGFLYFRLVPRDAPEGSRGVWLPREFIVARSGLLYWTVDSTQPPHVQQVTFDAFAVTPMHPFGQPSESEPLASFVGTFER